MTFIKNGKTDYLKKFKPLQVEICDGDSFEKANKAFKVLLQREKVISLYKERQSYEKPSDKKRRKRREAEEKRLASARKARLIESGEWNKRIQKRNKKEE